MICLPMGVKILPLILTLLGGVFGYCLNLVSAESSLKSLGVYPGSYKNVYFFGKI